MMGMVGIVIVADERAVGRIDRRQIAGPFHAFRLALARDHAEVVDENGLAAVRQLQAGGGDLPEGEGARRRRLREAHAQDQGENGLHEIFLSRRATVPRAWLPAGTAGR